LIEKSLVVLLTLAFPRRAAKGQGAVQANCSGRVSDTAGNAVAQILVDTVEPTGRVVGVATDAQGNYTMAAPNSGPFQIQFREPAGKTVVMVVDHLTGGTNQTLSVTVTINGVNFQSANARLDGVSKITAWLAGADDPRVRQRYFEHVTRESLFTTVEKVRKDLREAMDFLDQRQRRYLAAKADTVAGQLQVMP
jgi:VCBS repeat-containing protein